MENRWVIVDLDGTLADIDHRLHFLKETVRVEAHHRTDPDWDSFNKACVNDKPKKNVIELVNALAEQGYRIVIMTGRNEKYRDETLMWLREHDVRHNLLLMRGRTDYRPDTDVKGEMIYLMAEKGWIIDRHNILCVLEDRDKVVEFWRNFGLLCLQVEKGRY